ncbi:MAG: 6-bladed beta-propeller [Acidobacteriota bacterium]|nr:6-bladed beta-propeller [Acidobacteriota bacterium]
MKTIRVMYFVFLAAALASAACGRGGRESAPEHVRTEIHEGVVFVHNGAVPVHPEKTVRFEKEIDFGGSEGEPGEVYRPGPFTVDEAGRVYIVDRSDQSIKIFESDGSFARKFGRSGQGPGEFQSISHLAVRPDGRILVLDAQARRTTILEPTGEFVSSHPWTASMGTLLVLSDVYIVLESARTDSETEIRVKTYDYEGREIRNWGKFVAPAFRSVTRKMGESMVTVGISVPYSPRSVFAGDPSGRRLYHCLNDAYVIEVYDDGGKLIRKIHRSYELLPVTEKDKTDYLKRFDSSPQARELREGMPFPQVKTVTENMFADDRGFLWVATPVSRTEGDPKLTAFDIFDEEGIYDARVWLDKVPGRVFSGNRMYRLDEDPESGLSCVARYAVIWDELEFRDLDMTF